MFILSGVDDDGDGCEVCIKETGSDAVRLITVGGGTRGRAPALEFDEDAPVLVRRMTGAPLTTGVGISFAKDDGGRAQSALI
jgi:hypothetical protein